MTNPTLSHPDNCECRLCWLAQNDARYQQAWGIDPANPPRRQLQPVAPARVRSVTGCKHLGEATGETVTCPSCRGHVQVKLFGCQVHTKCTLVKTVPETACCRVCHEYEDKTP